MNAPATTISALFEAGNYAAVALHGPAADWQTYAALGLVGKTKEAIQGLQRFDHLEARFYVSVAHWIGNDETRAAELLKEIPLPHAQNLLALIRKRPIHVLAQLDRGSQWDFLTALQKDSKFAVRNIGFRAGDVPNKPDGDVCQFCDPRNPPDFYVAKMVEWHLLPPNLQELSCPILGHTADYDLHIQTVHPWLQLFDELVVTDPTEWQDVARLVHRPVATFPKAFGLGQRLPPVPTGPRPTDAFISGTALHPYHPDKARLLHQILGMPELSVKFINGFLGADDYHHLLGQTKVGFTYVRHPGAMPTRGLESLAMGAAIAVQEGSVLQVFVGENEGVVTYNREKESLPSAVRHVLRHWAQFEERARRGAALVRHEFDLARVASQYFRFLTFLAARPRGPRQILPRERLDQKRSILLKGWVPSPWVNRRVRQQSFTRWTSRLETNASPRPLIDMARELVLEYATAAYPPVARDCSRNFQAKLTVDRNLLTQAFKLYHVGVQRFPGSLVLRFNWVRAALHFGEPEEATEAINLAQDILTRPLTDWQVDVMDDVFPWDFFSQFFNYREYFDLATRHLQTGEPVQGDLARLITASLHYYLSFYPGTPVAHATIPPGVGHALQAIELDPAFPSYKLQGARLLVRRGVPEAIARAVPMLVELASHSMLFRQAFGLLEELRNRKLADPPEFERLATETRQATSGIHSASYGVEDWEAIPLRRAAQDERPTEVREPIEPVATARCHSTTASPPTAPARRTRILFLPFEITEWKQARHLAYPAQLGLEEGLSAHGVEFVTLPMVRGLSPTAQTTWLREVQARCSGERFDQVWAEVVHSEWTEDALRWLATVAPKRVGFVMESLRYDREVFEFAPALRNRQALVEHRLRFLTHALAVDEQDAANLNQHGVVAALWWPQAVPMGCIGRVPDPPPDRRAVFYGQIYGARMAWLEHPQLKELMWRPDHSPEDADGYPRLFDEANRAFGSLLDRGVALGGDCFGEHTQTLRRLRRASFKVWLSSLQHAPAVVNLPSFFQGYAGRVFETMAAGRPAVAWEIPNRPRTRALFTDSEEILLYPRDNPAALADHIRHLQRDPDFAQALARQAREKLLRLHTLERRVGQILNWIETGAEPDFCAGARVASGTPPRAPEVVYPACNSAGGLSPGEVTGFQGIAPDQVPGAPSALVSPCRADASRLPGVESAELWLALARARLSLGEHAVAFDLLTRAAAFQPENPAIQVGLATAAVGLGRWQEFEDALSRVLEKEPDHREALRLLGDLSFEHGLQGPASEIQRTILSREPHDIPARVNLAAAHARLAPPTNGSFSTERLARFIQRWLPGAAAAAERRVRSSRSGSVPAVARLGALGPARAHLQNGDLRAAWGSTLEAMQVRPFHPEGFLLLAEISSAAGDPARARWCAERARGLAPGWKPPKQFLKSLPKTSGLPKADLPALPGSLAPAAPRLTVCLIAKNEERFVGRCLDSIRGVADQIVCVDTGSTDWTRQIAERFGAEVSSFPWSDDFSAARNAALEQARGDWILFLDADEELGTDARETLRKGITEPSVMAYRLPIVDVGREEEGCSYVPRLFRNAPGLFYVGRVHEQVFTSVEVRRAEWGLENRFGKATLLHHGYTEKAMKERNKVERNLALLERAIEEIPNEPHLIMNYGLELMRAGQPSAALEQYWQAFRLLCALPPGQVVPELRETLLTQLATHLLGARQFREVVEILESKLACAGGLTASMHFVLGLALIELQQFAEAAVHLRHCLVKRNLPALSPVNKDIRKGGPNHCLALCLKRLERPAEAAKAFKTALTEDPESRPVRFDYAMFLAENGQPLEALKLLHELAFEKPEEVSIWLAAGRIALSRPETLEFACDWTGEAITLFPSEPQLLMQRAEALLLSQHPAEALSVLREIRGTPSPHLEAARLLCELLGNQDWSRRTSPEPVLSQEFLKWYRALLDRGAEPLVGAINSRLDRLRQVLPSASRWLEQALLEADREAAV